MTTALFPRHPPLVAPASLPGAVPGASRVDRAWAVLHTVPDPEVPAVSVCDLGIVREVSEPAGRDGGLRVTVTPTYSGCPATEAIAEHIAEALEDAGLGAIEVVQRRAPAWTTDWISDLGRERLRAYGIAPPGPALAEGDAVVHVIARGVRCPHCHSAQTEKLSAFGSTPCKALYRCLACREPFDLFKAI